MNPIKEYKKAVIELVSKMLEEEPENFTAISLWGEGDTLNDFIRYKNTKKSITVTRSGSILNPINLIFEMTWYKKRKIRKLCKPIFKRDAKFLLKKQFNIE